jgi:hypothetical protein
MDSIHGNYDPRAQVETSHGARGLLVGIVFGTLAWTLLGMAVVGLAIALD